MNVKMSKDQETEYHDGPNIVGYYKMLLSSILSELEPTSNKEETVGIRNEQFFNDIFGSAISEGQKEMLKSDLRASIASLNHEADEMLRRLVMLQIDESDQREDSILEASRRKRKAQCSNEICSPELLNKICKTKQGVDELLNEIASHCRLMSAGEKERLGARVQKLPEKAFDRVLEILKCESLSFKNIPIDLNKQDDVTLWRLYYYVETVLYASKV